MRHVAVPPAKPLLIFDGDCGFCRRWIERWQQKTADRVEYLPFQDERVAVQFPEIPREEFTQSVQLIEPDGAVYDGAEAVYRSLGRQRAYEKIPGLAPLSEWAYRLVARHRQMASAFTPKRSSYTFTCAVFVRLLGLIYLCAFLSLWSQMGGLIGSHGIIPTGFLLESGSSFKQLPTVLWLSHSDAALDAVCALGVVLSVLTMAGMAVMPALIGLWVLYLSISAVGNVFLGYQWDALLLEVGFLAIWIAPVGRLMRSEPPRLVLWMFRWLLFRFMLSSGAVKLTSGDSNWHNLRALTLHYETQPLPTWIGWYAHQLPAWFHQVSCALMFGIELGLPWLIFAGRRARQVACAGFVFLMVLISLTGNYCFFNLLTCAMCVLLLDDAAFGSTGAHTPAKPWRNWAFLPVAAAMIIASFPLVCGACGWRFRWPQPAIALHQHLGGLRSLNSYGLFAVMTASRPEIIVEGSEDGMEWKPYEFKYKPGDLAQRPRFCWPHQPRVDWQMWFAALGDYRGNPWFINFCVRLLQNEPAVTRLLAHNPFPGKPPLYIRALVYDYHFTTFAERRATGHWWKRELKGLYCPILAAKNP